MGAMSFSINTKINVINSIIFQIPKHNHEIVRDYATPKIIFTYNDSMEFTYDLDNVITPLTYGLLFLMNYQFTRDSYYNRMEYLRILSLYNIRFESTTRILSAKNIMHTIISDNAREDANYVTYELPGIEDNINMSSTYSIPYSIEYITKD